MILFDFRQSTVIIYRQYPSLTICIKFAFAQDWYIVYCISISHLLHESHPKQVNLVHRNNHILILLHHLTNEINELFVEVFVFDLLNKISTDSEPVCLPPPIENTIFAYDYTYHVHKVIRFDLRLSNMWTIDWITTETDFQWAIWRICLEFWLLLYCCSHLKVHQICYWQLQYLLTPSNWE